MFLVDKDAKFIDPSSNKVLALLKSSNQPLIAAADRPAEPTEAYICAFQKKNKRMETYIMLQLMKSGIRVFYRSEREEFLPNEFSEVEADALEFLESMGFTMDNVGLQKMDDAKKREFFSSFPVFIDPSLISEEPKEVEEPDYVSSAELAEGLEEVLSEQDLKEMELEEKSQEPADLLASFAKEIDAEPLAGESTKADPVSPEGVGTLDPEKVAPLSLEEINAEDLDKAVHVSGEEAGALELEKAVQPSEEGASAEDVEKAPLAKESPAEDLGGAEPVLQEKAGDLESGKAPAIAPEGLAKDLGKIVRIMSSF